MLTPCLCFCIPFLPSLSACFTLFRVSFPLSFCLCCSVPTDVLHGLRGHHEGDGVDGERGENEEKGRTEQEKLHFGGGDGDYDDGDDRVAGATSVSALVTNPLPLEALLPATSSTQGPLKLINRGSELTSLGKITAESV